MLPGNPRAVPVEYVRYALLGLAHHGRPARVLMVGLGGGTFTTLVHRALPGASVDAVEIDPVVVEAARAWFDLREDARYRVHVADAADWLRRDRGAYDYVLLDAYAGEDIPGRPSPARRSSATSRRAWRRAASSRSTSPSPRGAASRRRAPSPPCSRRSNAVTRQSTATSCCSRRRARAWRIRPRRSAGSRTGMRAA